MQIFFFGKDELANDKLVDQIKKQHSLVGQNSIQECINYFANKKATIITNGPLTLLANALLIKPEITQNIDQILLIGGSDSYGDITPSAEANIYADPISAQIIMKCGVPIIMFGLNVTRNIPDYQLLPLKYLANPDSFKLEEAGCYVETRGKYTIGKTVNDLYSDKQFENKNVKFVMSVD